MSETNGNAPLEVAVLAKEEDDTVSLDAVEVQQGAGTSHQTPDPDDLWTPGDCLPPPESLWDLQRLTDFSSIRNTCLGALVRNSVGLGWDVDAWPQRRGEVNEDDFVKARERIDACARRDKRMDKPSFSGLMEAVKRDQKEIGNGYFEVSRNKRTGQVDGLFYLPGILMRRKRDRSGYVMGQNPESVEGDPVRTEYLNFGEKVLYDDDGQPRNRLASGARRWATNEVVALREYTSVSRDYGLPRDVALAVEYAASRFVNEWTTSFFSGSGVPPKMVFVQGQEERGGDNKRIKFSVPAQTMRRIDQALKSDAKPGARVVVIPVPPGTDVSEVDLGELSERDLTFTEFKRMHRRHVGSALGPLSPIFYGDVEDAGRYTAEVQRSITLEQVFDPDQRDTEDRLWNTLLYDMGFSALRVAFKRLAVEGDAVRRESANSMAEVGAITVVEFREAHGKGPLSEEEHGKEVNKRIIDTGRPKGAQDRVGVGATEDQRGLRPGIGGRVAKEQHDHGVPHVEEEVERLTEELAEYAPVEPLPDEARDGSDA